MTTWIHCHIHQLLTKCVLSLFNRDEIKQITVLCRLTNTGLFALSSKTVHWSMTLNVFLHQDQNSNRIRLHHDWFFFYRLPNSTFNYDVIDKTSDSFTHKGSKFTVREDEISSLIHGYWTYLQMWRIKFDTKLKMFLNCIQWN